MSAFMMWVLVIDAVLIGAGIVFNILTRMRMKRISNRRKQGKQPDKEFKGAHRLDRDYTDCVENGCPCFHEVDAGTKKAAGYCSYADYPICVLEIYKESGGGENE